MTNSLGASRNFALTAGDASRCRTYADELLAVAAPNGLREIEAIARHWRGESWLAEKAYVQARTELSCAAVLAEEVGRLRLQRDAQAALARCLEAQGERDAARHHGGKAFAMAQAIEQSLVSSGLDARLQ